MTSEQFLKHLQEHAASFAKAVATNEGEWIIKGFIDVYQRVYSISVDTKIVSKVLELLLFPMFVEFAKKHGLVIELCQHQNFYPDLTFHAHCLRQPVRGGHQEHLPGERDESEWDDTGSVHWLFQKPGQQQEHPLPI